MHSLKGKKKSRSLTLVRIRKVRSESDSLDHVIHFLANAKLCLVYMSVFCQSVDKWIHEPSASEYEEEDSVILSLKKKKLLQTGLVLISQE